MEQEKLILEKLANLEKLSLLNSKRVLLMDDVALLTGLSKSRIYQLTCNHQIPFYKPSCRALTFEKSEIEKWLLQNRQETIDESMHKTVLRQ